MIKRLLLMLPLLFPSLQAETELRQGLMAEEKLIYLASIESCVAKGKPFLPTLREWAKEQDPRLKARARTAIGQITGQWAAPTDLLWQRDFKQATKKASKEKKPIMVLQLFGRFDQEFC